MTLKFGSKECFVFIISIVLLTDLAILLNIPFLRQILGFIFLTILPGLLILRILKLNKIGFTGKIVLAVGLSIAFLMFFGLLLNNLSLSLGYETPLATIPLLISFNLAFVLSAIVAYKLNKDAVFSLPNLNLSTSEKAFLIVPISFPALSIFGMNLMNTTDNNIILMLLLFLIPIYVIFVCVFNHKFPNRIYPVVIFLISISLILLLPLRSNHIIGVDTHQEYYYFQITLSNLYWSTFGHFTLDACLAISLLPTIYQSILNIPSEFLYKILPSLIYSVSPLVIYVISKKYVEESYAFLASCFFMFQAIFLMTEVHARANIAIFFFALAMLTLFNDKIDPLKKRFLFIVFMASCMVSHYSTTYIFFFVMAGTFIGEEALSKKYTFKKIISLTIVILFFAMIFFWYSQVTEAAFDSGVVFIETTLKSLHEFFILESRGAGQALLGGGLGQKGIPHKIEFVFTWLTFVFIGIGVATLIRRYKEMSFPELEFKKLDFLKTKFEVGYFVVTLACVGLLAMVITVPFIAQGYGLSRVYPFAITILSVFFVIGGLMIAKYSNKVFAVFRRNNPFRKNIDERRALQLRAYLIIFVVLIPYFFCATGVSYQMFGVPRAITLNSEGRQYDMMYVHDQESHGAKWLWYYTEPENLEIYTDYLGDKNLISQAGILPSAINRHLLLDERDIKIKGYIYLQYNNVVNGELVGRRGRGPLVEYNMTQYRDKFVGKGKIYTNGCTEVYK